MPIRRRLHPVAAALVAALLAGLAAAPPRAEPATQPVGVRLELSQLFFYEGDPLPVRVTARNTGDVAVDNPVKGSLFDALQATDAEGKPLQRTKAEPAAPERPDRIGPQSFYGGVVDATELYPALGRPGSYSISWSAGGILSERLDIVVIPKYDPAKKHRATVETDQGSILVDFFPDRSPVAVKAFVDLARSGYYDGLTVHETRPDTFIVAGDPTAAGVARYPFQFPAELSSLPMVSGTVLLKPAGAAPPANGPQFIILLKPQPNWTGQVTVLGQVVRGLDVVQKLSKAPNSGAGGRPNFAPLTPIRIRNVTIDVLEDDTRSTP